MSHYTEVFISRLCKDEGEISEDKIANKTLKTFVFSRNVILVIWYMLLSLKSNIIVFLLKVKIEQRFTKRRHLQKIYFVFENIMKRAKN